MLQDLRYTLRTLRRHPLISAAAVVTLALGIGGAAAVFTVVDAVLLRPLPFDQPDRLVRIWELTPDGQRFPLSDPDYLDLVAETRTLQAVAAFRNLGGTWVLDDGGEPERITVMPVSASLAGVLGVAPALGRTFVEEEDRRTAGERPIVLSNGLWRRRFGADPEALGRVVTLDGAPAVVIGVMPARFDFPGGVDAWVPLALDAQRDRADSELAVIGRLAPAATIAQLRRELRDVVRRLGEMHPRSRSGWSAEAIGFSEWIVTPRFREAIWVLAGAVGVLLLLACANVASLLLAQATARAREMQIRGALGATRTRLVRQLLTESATLAILGTVAALLLASWSVEVLRALGGGRVPRLDELHLSPGVLGFTCLTGIVSCLIFGLVPALHGAKTDLRSSMDEQARYAGGSRRLRHALVVVEVALALLLLVGAGLLGNSFVRLMQADPGFDSAEVIAMPVDLPPGGADNAAVFVGRLLERVASVPGVVEAGATSTNPFRQGGYSNDVTPAERAADAPPSGLLQAGWRSVTPGFFEAMGIPLFSGRTFAASDTADAERVVIVSETLARQLWPGELAVGRRIYWGGTTGRTRTVIGVSGDIRDVSLEAEPPPILFVPHAQVPVPGMTVVIRTPLDAAAIAPALRSVVREMDSRVPAPAIGTIDGSRMDAARRARFNLWLMGAFAAIALALAVTGVYAILAFTVRERRREIAIRLALGASPSSIANRILLAGLSLAGAGVLAGTFGALGASRVLSTLLYSVEPTDPLTFGGAAVSVLAIAALACWLPARYASRLDPSEVLRD